MLEASIFLETLRGYAEADGSSSALAFCVRSFDIGEVCSHTSSLPSDLILWFQVLDVLIRETTEPVIFDGDISEIIRFITRLIHFRLLG